MPKIVYVIPGFHGSTEMKRYKKIIKNFKKKNFKVVPIKITWEHRTMTDYLEECRRQLKRKENDKVYLFGFSLGAMLAFIIAKEVNAQKLILCSLSPFFKEDLKFIKKSWRKYMGKRRMRDFNNFSFKSIVKEIKCEVILIVGTQEDNLVQRRVDIAHKNIKTSKLFTINARHNISQATYQQTISDIIDRLK